MAAQSLTSFDASLKDLYEGMVRRIFNRQVRLWKYAKKGTKPFEGRRVVFPITVQASATAAFYKAGTAMPAAQPQLTKQLLIPMRQLWTRIQLNHDVIQLARSNRGSFERPLAFEVKRQVEDMIKRCNQYMFGDGTGVLGEVHSVSSQVITCRAGTTASAALNGNQGNRYIRPGSSSTYPGDTLDIYAQADYTTLRGTGAFQVVAYSAANNTVTIKTGQDISAVVAGDRIFQTGQAVSPGTIYGPSGGGTEGVAGGCDVTGDGWPMGIGGIVDDGTVRQYLYGIDRTAYPIMKANAINIGTDFVTPAALTLDYMQRATDLSSEGGNGYPGVALCHQSIRREYLKLVQTDRRYIEKFKYDPGISEGQLDEWPWRTSLDFDGFPLAFDFDCQWRRMYFLDGRLLQKYEGAPFHWLSAPNAGASSGGAGYFQLLPGSTGAGIWEAQGLMMWNLGIDETGPASSTVLRFISGSITDRSEAAAW